MNYYSSENKTFLFVLLLCVLSAFATSSAVKRKDINSVWVLLTFIFPPFFFVVSWLPSNAAQLVQMINCEACHKEISSASKICLHCGHPNYLSKKNRPSFYEWFIGGLIIIAIGFITIYPSAFTSNGIPNCDTSFTQKLAKDTLNKIPIIHTLGISTINLKNIKETTSSSTERSCRATAILNNDVNFPVLYQLTRQHNDLYLKIQIDNLMR